MENIVDQIYKLRSSFVIIGLTGKTGSGCSTVANLLKKDKCSFHAPMCTVKLEGISNDERKENIIKEYFDFNYKPFTVIKASDIIIFFAIMDGYEGFLNSFVTANAPEEVLKYIKDETFKNKFNKINNIAKDANAFINKRESRNLIDPENKELKDTALRYKSFFFKDLRSFAEELKENVSSKGMKMFSVLQKWGDNIRSENKCYSESKISDEELEDKPAYIAKKINLIIKLLRDISRVDRNDNNTYVVIDALRNPYEILFFRERYSAFYTMSVNTPPQKRKENLIKLNYRDDEIEKLDKKESPEASLKLNESFTMQDINSCIEFSDIHIFTDGSKLDYNNKLKKQLMRYVCLMLHPGLVPPTPLERTMQCAYIAKLNSGCLSRQVGACVTDEDYSIKAIGWNTVPKGQTPCSLRKLEDVINKTDLSAYSNYELNNLKICDEFKIVYEKYFKKYNNPNYILKGTNLSYCFKDIYNLANNENNQVHTRSLHAEENAFLQLAKYGGQGIKGGKLFTTSSPCVLCAKKAYQLGIKEVYYIDAYPDITMDHIFKCGTNQPRSFLFEGAIGRAYENLYTPIVPQKDEIAERFGVYKQDLQEDKNKKEKN